MRTTMIRRIFRFLLPAWLTAIVAAFIILLKIGFEVASVYFLSPAITTVATAFSQSETLSFWNWFMGSTDAATQLRSLLLWMSTAQVGMGLMIFLRSYWETKLSMTTAYHMRAAVFDRLQRSDISYYNRTSTGKIINRAIEDLQAVRHFVNFSLMGGLEILATVAFYLCLLYLRSPLLMAAALIPLPVWWYFITRFGRELESRMLTQQDIADKMMTQLSENLGGAHVVRAFGIEESEIAKYSELNERNVENAYKMVRINARLVPTLRLASTFSHIGLFIWASWLIRADRLSVGDLLLLGIAMSALFSKIELINNISNSYRKARVSAQRLFEILDLPDLQIMPSGSRPADIQYGEIRFENVTFGFDSEPVLRDLNAVIPAGQVTALVGPTGSGKSTMCDLIGRFYDPQKGRVTIDGIDVREFDLHELRRNIGYVFQETFLFSTSIKDNIRFGRMDVSDEMILQAARLTYADEFIEKLPDRYNTIIHQGVQLSGGQKQRIALARALVYDPKILILDDALAALDPSTQHGLQIALAPVLQGRTVLVIAHRLASVRWADQILVLQDGRIVQSGKHEELAERDSYYREIIKLHEIGAVTL